MGSILAIGIIILYFYLPVYVNEAYNYRSFDLSFIIICLSTIFALTFLNQKNSYFLLFYIPLILPFLYIQFYLLIDYDNHFSLFLFTDIILFLVLICSSLFIQTQKRLTRVHYKNTLLTRRVIDQTQQKKILNQKLRDEIQKSQTIERQLFLYTKALKHNIKKLDIKSTQHNLRNIKFDFIFTHHYAHLILWNKNIKHNLQQNERKLIHNFNDQNKSFVHSPDFKNFKDELFKQLRGLSHQFEAKSKIQLSDRKWYWIHDISRVINRYTKNPFTLHMVDIQKNTHHECSNQERLRLSASVLLQQAAEGIFILNHELQYIDVNPFYEQLTGFDQTQLLGKNLFAIVENHQKKLHHFIINEVLSTGKYDNEITVVFLSGHKRTLRLHINAIQDDQNQVINYIGIVSDLTEKRLQEQRLSYLENYDALTDLPNRFYYNYQLHQYLVKYQDDRSKKLAIIRLNVDRFRHLNEYLTDQGGDEFLKQLAQRLRICNKKALFLAHLNGDNFAIVYELSTLQSSIQHMCEKITKQLEIPFHINGEDHVITVSMGIAFYPEHGRQIDYLNNYAEQALNEAKRLGGDMIRIYNFQTELFNEQNIQLERDLKNAIKNEELSVYYQPKLYFKDSKIQGFEALVRWNHPTKGLIYPNTFLPIAEQTSLISDIGQFVILKTAEQLQKWIQFGYEDIVISLNIVAQQLHRGSLLDTIDRALEKYQISGSNIELEITESSLVDNSDTVKNTLDELIKRDIRIALDDFGTGYSSLSYLTQFPIRTLKIDRSFISHIGQPKQEALVSAIIAMGKAMGMTLVAEGVETEEQLEYLSKHQCDIAQGFLFSKVLTEEDATAYLTQNYQTEL
ncbi:EAL domain-containing protein [Acinetobacter sp. ANC 4558]|uniref:EAL domain-containing protein n=1 Tax=Acinetobacter sp. ANC 4558 TaxID=1977876 RepID=UPI003A0FC360